MKDSSPLDELTPDVLEADAQAMEGLIGFLVAHGYVAHQVEPLVRSAALCRAVAKANRAMNASDELAVAHWAGQMTAFFGPNDPFPYPTLAAALGAMGETETRFP